MTFQTVTVTWNETDPALLAQAGSVTFQLTAPLIDGSSGQIADQAEKTYFFTSGTGTSDPLTANDSAGAVPSGTAYRITVAVTGQQPRTFTSQLLHANGATQTLGFLEANAAVPAVQYAQYLPLPSGTPSPGQVPVATGAGEASAWTSVGGTGTVTSVSVVSANGLAGSVANPTSTPAVTLSTTVTGVLKGNGTAISAAVPGTDYDAGGAAAALVPLTTLGDMLYENSTPASARLAGNTSATKNFLTQTGTGTVSAAPAWGTIAAGDLPAATTSTQGAVKLDGTASDIQPTGSAAAAGSVGQAADAGHVHAGWGKLATTGASGYTLVNSTGTIISWTAPNDGALHRVQVIFALRVTSNETGGQMGTTVTFPDSSAQTFASAVSAGGATAGASIGTLSYFIAANSTASVKQNSALTGGAAVLWAEIWGS